MHNVTLNNYYLCLLHNVKRLCDNIKDSWDNVLSDDGLLILNEVEKIVTSYKNVKNNNILLEPIFKYMNGEHNGYYLSPSPITDVISMPMTQKPAHKLNSTEIGNKINDYILNHSANEDNLSSFLTLLETELSYLPSEYYSDISAFDIAKITGAFVASLSEYFVYNGITNIKAFISNDNFRDEKLFLLYSADLSGIQKFIYTVSTEKALRSLRSRSFFLNFAMEHYVDELLTACGLCRANLLYSGGGHCYIILPNTQDVIKKIDDWNTRFNEFLLDEFNIGLFIGNGYTECSVNDFINYPAENAPYKDMFRRVSSKISAHKMQRYSPEQILKLNSQTLAGERECKICGRNDRLTDENLCSWCDCFAELSSKIQDTDVFIVSKENKNADFSLPSIDDVVHFSFTDISSALKRIKNNENIVRIYTKNVFYSELANSIRLYVGSYALDNLLSNLAKNSKGIKRIGVCRMDVDNLGQAFVSGFEVPDTVSLKEKYKYVNIARTAAFSRQMSLFFQLYINNILSGKNDGEKALNLSIVYSGGDDVFLVGAWNDVLKGANRIQQNFNEYTCGSLTISAGFGIFTPTFPIKASAERTAELEDRAKQEPNKSSISLFDPNAEHTYSWDTYRNKVIDEKLKVIQNFFDNEKNLGNSLLYGLLNLLRLSLENDGRINLARFAYQLARLEPQKNSANYQNYRVFIQNMYRWACNKDIDERKQLITAIYIYVYLNRKEEKDGLQ